MDSSHLEVTVRREQRAAILDLGGEIDGFSENDLAAAYAEAERTDPEAILLNFARVDYINSTGIALIVDLLAEARTAHRRLLAYGLSDHYVEIFAITRLSDFVTVLADEASALNDVDQRVRQPRANT